MLDIMTEETSSIASTLLRYVSTGRRARAEGRKQHAGESRVELTEEGVKGGVGGRWGRRGEGVIGELNRREGGYSMSRRNGAVEAGLRRGAAFPALGPEPFL